MSASINIINTAHTAEMLKKDTEACASTGGRFILCVLGLSSTVCMLISDEYIDC